MKYQKTEKNFFYFKKPIAFVRDGDDEPCKMKKNINKENVKKYKCFFCHCKIRDVCFSFFFLPFCFSFFSFIRGTKSTTILIWD